MAKRQGYEALRRYVAQDDNENIVPLTDAYEAEQHHWNATIRLPCVAPVPSFRRAGMPNPGRPPVREPLPGMKQSMRRDILVAQSGDGGAGTTAEAASRQRCNE